MMIMAPYSLAQAWASHAGSICEGTNVYKVLRLGCDGRHVPRSACSSCTTEGHAR